MEEDLEAREDHDEPCPHASSFTVRERLRDHLRALECYFQAVWYK